MKESLQTLVELFCRAADDFRSCPEMLSSSGNISIEAKEISWRFFTLREQLLETGLELKKKTRGGLSEPLDKAVYRWAIWKQAASHTSTMALSNLSEDSALIMKKMGEAEQAMFDACLGDENSEN